MKTANDIIQPAIRSEKKREMFSILMPWAVTGGVVLILYFIIMIFTGLYVNTDLRYFNFVILLPFVILAISNYTKHGRHRTYLQGILVGIGTFLGAYFLLSLFVTLYLAFADPSMMALIRVKALPELQLNPFSIGILLMGEGSIGALIEGYLVMQYFKDDIRNVA